MSTPKTTPGQLAAVKRYEEKLKASGIVKYGIRLPSERREWFKKKGAEVGSQQLFFAAIETLIEADQKRFYDVLEQIAEAGRT